MPSKRVWRQCRCRRVGAPADGEPDAAGGADWDRDSRGGLPGARAAGDNGDGDRRRCPKCLTARCVWLEHSTTPLACARPWLSRGMPVGAPIPRLSDIYCVGDPRKGGISWFSLVVPRRCPGLVAADRRSGSGGAPAAQRGRTTLTPTRSTACLIARGGEGRCVFRSWAPPAAGLCPVLRVSAPRLI